MLLKFFIDYPYVVYSIITWGFVFVFLRKDIKRLWPFSILAAIMIFIAMYWLITVGVYKSEIEFLPVFGIPFFFIVWGAGNGIVFAYFFGEKTLQRLLSIPIFAGIAVGFEWFVEHYKRVQHMGKFTDVHEFIYDIFILSTLSLIMTGFFGSRLIKDKKR
jgi:hypothetical protein